MTGPRRANRAVAFVLASWSLAAIGVAAPSILVTENFTPVGTEAVFWVYPSPDLVGPEGSVLSISLVGSELEGLLLDASVDESAWPTPILAENPYAGGSTAGLWNEQENALFASFESAPLFSTEPIEFLRIDIEYSPYGQLFDYTATVTQDGQAFEPIASGFGIFIDLFTDINGDGVVDLLDLDILGQNFGKSPAMHSEGDLNGDNVVDLLDLDILGSTFSSRVAAVPEPSMLLAVAPAMPWLAAKRRRHAG